MKKEKNSYEKINKTGLYIPSFLCVAGFIFTLYVIANLASANFELVFTAVCYVLILVYVLWNYKVPHGNMMKYLFLIFGYSLIVRSIWSVTYYDFSILTALAYGLAAMFVCFTAGRLDRYEENKNLAVVIFCIIILAYVFGVISVEDAPRSIAYYTVGALIQWLAIATSYFSRYHEHKEAGKGK